MKDTNDNKRHGKDTKDNEKSNDNADTKLDREESVETGCMRVRCGGRHSEDNCYFEMLSATRAVNEGIWDGCASVTCKAEENARETNIG